MDLFDDYNKRKNFKRVELQFSNSINKTFNSLEIADILERFVSLYYKTSLVHSLAIFTNTDSDLSNILISKKSTSIEHIPDNGTFSFIKHLKFIYHTRLSHSLAYNKSHVDLDKMFSYFNRLYGFVLDLNIIDNIPIHKLNTYYKTLKAQGIFAVFKKIEQDILDEILVEKTRKIFLDFSRNSRISIIDNNSHSSEHNNGKVAIVKTPSSDFNLFFENLNIQKLPVITIYSEVDQMYQILSYRHLHQNTEKDNFDVKKIYHESPTTFLIHVAAQYVSPMLNGLIQSLSQISIGLKNTTDLKAINKKSNEDDIFRARVQIIKESIDTASLLESKYKTHLIEDIEEVKEPLLKKNLLNSLETIEQDYKQLISNYSLHFQSIKNI